MMTSRRVMTPRRIMDPRRMMDPGRMMTSQKVKKTSLPPTPLLSLSLTSKPDFQSITFKRIEKIVQDTELFRNFYMSYVNLAIVSYYYYQR